MALIATTSTDFLPQILSHITKIKVCQAHPCLLKSIEKFYDSNGQ